MMNSIFKRCSTCTSEVYARGLCRYHYDLRRRTIGVSGVEICTVDDCERVAHSKRSGLCSTHLYRKIASGEVPHPKCTVPGCTKHRDSLGFCPMHYRRFKKHGDPGQAESLFDGVKIDQYGYRQIYIKDRNHKKGGYYVLEHHLVMEKKIGRPLRDEETVHHKNGIRNDNRPSNLELWSTRHPYGQRVEDLLEWASQIIDLYSPIREILQSV